MWLSPSLLQGTRLVLGMQHLCQASRREEFRWALSVAVLGYGVAVRVLMLHALLAKGDRSTLVSCSDSHTVPAQPLASEQPRWAC